MSKPNLHAHDPSEEGGIWWQSHKSKRTFLSGIALIFAYGADKFFPNNTLWFFSAALLVGLISIAKRAIVAAMNGSPFSIEMLMTIAAVGAVFIGASEEAAAVVVLFLIGEMLEGFAVSKARSSIQSLTNLVPKTALLEENGQTREVSFESLTRGANIQVRPGDRIPADGLIISG